MKRLPVIAALVAAAMLASIPAAAQGLVDVPRLIRAEGWIVADHCGDDNTEPEARDRVLACYERGEPLLFQTKDGDLYTIAEPDKVLDRIGRRWIVLGSVQHDVLAVGTLIDPDDPGKASMTAAEKPEAAPAGPRLRPGAKPPRPVAPPAGTAAPADVPPAEPAPAEAVPAEDTAAEPAPAPEDR